MVNCYGCTQVLLSASQRDLLLKQTDTLGLTPFFDSILGLGDIYAKSKTELARRWILEKHIASDNICVIGDTVHDFQVSLELGCQCILICGGHNSMQRLKESNAIVIEDFSELPETIKSRLVCSDSFRVSNALANTDSRTRIRVPAVSPFE